jgi:hypothetical protein
MDCGLESVRDSRRPDSGMPLAETGSMHRRVLVFLAAGTVPQLTPTTGARAQSNPGASGGSSDGVWRPRGVVDPSARPLDAPLALVLPGSPPQPTRERRWYGHQVLLADTGALLLLMGLSSTHQDRAALYGSGGVWAGGAPLVHALHGRPAAAMGSLTIRAGVLLLATVSATGNGGCETTCKTAVGSCADDPQGDYWHTTTTSCDNFGALLGVMGILLVSTVDTILARDPVSAQAEASPPAVPHSRRPTIDNVGLIPTQSGAALSLAGHF